MNKTISRRFDKIEGTNDETSTDLASKIIVSNKLNSEESITHSDANSLYLDVPLKEAIEFALKNYKPIQTERAI